MCKTTHSTGKIEEPIVHDMDMRRNFSLETSIVGQTTNLGMFNGISNDEPGIFQYEVKKRTPETSIEDQATNPRDFSRGERNTPWRLQYIIKQRTLGIPMRDERRTWNIPTVYLATNLRQDTSEMNKRIYSW